MRAFAKYTMVVSCVLFLAGNVFAAANSYDINIYGASAQSNFWKNQGTVWMSSVLGCASTAKACAAKWDSTNGRYIQDSKDCIIKGTGCDADNDGSNDDTVKLAYSDKASFAGIFSINGEDPFGDNDYCDPDFSSQKMVNEANCDFSNGNSGLCCVDGSGGGAGSCGSLASKLADENDLDRYACRRVSLGASDVGNTAFKQKSYGWENYDDYAVIPGPPGQYSNYTIDRDFTAATGIPVTVDTNVASAARPIVVPFMFQKNCAIDFIPGDNLSRSQAYMLMTKQVKYWNEIFPTAPANARVLICARHAGSGTQATMDLGVLRGDSGVYPFDHYYLGTGSSPIVMLNQSSSNLTECVNDNGGSVIANASWITAGDTLLAIGYADADKFGNWVKSDGTLETNAADVFQKDGYENVCYLKYQGYTATAANVKTGAYPFWAEQYVYYRNAEVSAAGTDYQKFMSNSVVGIGDVTPSRGDNALLRYMNGHISDPTSRYWVGSDDMLVTKVDDFAMPSPK